MTPELQLEINEILCEERKTANSSYAIKLVEKIVFTTVGLILVAVIGALIGLVVTK